jgi:Zn-dependent peptidase ImmA (M78 family)/transcriptional regulator with XRE-family HTH domain
MGEEDIQFWLDATLVNGQRVRLARELRGLTQVDLAGLLGVDQTMVAHIERGTKQPSAEVLEHCASELRLPKAFFRQPNPPDFPRGSLLFRSKSGIGKKRVAEAHAYAAILFELALSLSQHASLVPVRLPPPDDPIIVARKIREAMHAGDGPLSNLVRAVERLGVLVLPLPDIADLDAFAVWAGPSREYPVMGLVAGTPPDRIRMSVAHELGHLILHRYVNSAAQELENQAYHFAAELLMPKDAILRDLAEEKLNLFRLAALKGIWGVSMQAILRRARELKIITDRQYRYLMKQIGMKGWRINEPTLTPLAVEKPRAIRKIAELVLGPSPNFKSAARELFITDEFLADIFENCDPPPTRGTQRRGRILRFARR